MARRSKKYNVLAIGDMHEPFTLDGYIDFLNDTYKKYQCNRVVNIGDEFDWHCFNFHGIDTEAMSTNEELKLAKQKMKKLMKLFPNMEICFSNHGSLPYRKARSVGIPDFFLKPYGDIIDAPKGWVWKEEFFIDNVKYVHEPGLAGKHAIKRAPEENMCNIVFGHLHTLAGVEWICNDYHKYFGLATGCGIDRQQYAFGYAKSNIKKPMIACGVVLEGKQPISVTMDI